MGSLCISSPWWWLVFIVVMVIVSLHPLVQSSWFQAFPSHDSGDDRTHIWCCHGNCPFEIWKMACHSLNTANKTELGRELLYSVKNQNSLIWTSFLLNIQTSHPIPSTDVWFDLKDCTSIDMTFQWCRYLHSFWIL